MHFAMVFKLEGGLVLTRQMLVYGSVFLVLPVVMEQPTAFELNYAVIGCLPGLAIFPTIFGFYCNTKAIEYLSPSQVQILELSEPIFAALIAFVFLHEVPGPSTPFGGMLIVLCISIANGLLHFSHNSRSVNSIK